MPRYSYVVKDKDGQAFKNIIDADSKQFVIEKLQNQNFFIISIEELAVGKAAAAKQAFIVKRKKKKFSHKKAKLQDLLIFSRQLATMLESGVTLIRSLDVILSQIESEQFFNVMSKIKKDVEQGASLSSALSYHPKIFNQFWVSLVEVGEASGTIPVVLNKFAFYLEQQHRFQTAIASGMIYPAILFLVAVGAISFFATVVGPRFETVFKTMNVELPVLTIVLLRFFSFVKTYFLVLTGSVAISIFAVFKYVQTYRGKLLFEKFLFSLPTFGEIYRLIIVERFSSQMAILMDAGVPILYALDIAERLVDNNTCAIIVNSIKESVRKGELLVGPMERSGFFPPMCIQMIMVGEETGELSKMLNHVSKFYQETVETFMQRFSTIIEPFMLVFMGGVIGTIIVAMFLPMFNIAKLGGAG